MRPSTKITAYRLALTCAVVTTVLAAQAAAPRKIHRAARHGKTLAPPRPATTARIVPAARSGGVDVPAPEDTHPLSSYPVSTAELRGRWRGDGSAPDDTRQNNGSTTGGVSYAPAMNGRGFRFNGRDDAVRIADSVSLTLTRSLTFNAWVNVDEFNSPGEDKGMILFRGDDRAGLDPYGLWVGSDQRLTFHIESTEHSEEISAPIPGRRFVMVTAILDDSTGQMSLYENTVLVARVVTRVRPLTVLDPTAHPGIGIGNCNAVPDSGYRYPFHGVINDLRVYARPLAPGEIHRLYADSLSVPSPLPIAAEAAGQ